MKSLINLSCSLFLITVNSFSYGQMTEYNYMREIQGSSDQWNKIILPNELFGKSSEDLNDVRIFGFTENNDTIEAPYFIKLTTEKASARKVSFETLNTSHNNNGSYITFKIPSLEPVNQIMLEFVQENFDWRVTLEGSQDQVDWFKVVENYRILSIKNKKIDFQFTKLTFPSSNYRFFRLAIKSKEKPKLKAAHIVKNEITDGAFEKYNVKKISKKENKESKQTEIDVELKLPVPISHLDIEVSNTFDFYRPVTIKYLTDSFKIKQRWHYKYRTLTTGVLNSIEKNGFQFSNTTVQKLKIFINNGDNQPLTINAVEVKGNIHELITRFIEKATYYLAYGNKKAIRPSYDIEHFSNKIPGTLKVLEVGTELKIEKRKPKVTGLLFKDEIWLWTTMIAMILLLGWFTIKMMQKN